MLDKLLALTSIGFMAGTLLVTIAFFNWVNHHLD
jgi:hypothetical protein